MKTADLLIDIILITAAAATCLMWFSTKKKDQLIITRTHDLSRDEILSYQKDGILIMREQLLLFTHSKKFGF